MDPVSILQWNCQSLISKKSEILYLINKFNKLVLALSETWLKPCQSFNVRGFSCIRDDRTDGYAGCVLHVNNSIPYS